MTLHVHEDSDEAAERYDSKKNHLRVCLHGDFEELIRRRRPGGGDSENDADEERRPSTERRRGKQNHDPARRSSATSLAGLLLAGCYCYDVSFSPFLGDSECL